MSPTEIFILLSKGFLSDCGRYIVMIYFHLNNENHYNIWLRYLDYCPSPFIVVQLTWLLYSDSYKVLLLKYSTLIVVSL